MTPAETNFVRREVERELKTDAEERLAHTKALMKASGARLI